MQYVAFDSHKKYTWARVEDERGHKLQEARIDHHKGSLRTFLAGCQPGSRVAVETIGSWYWIVDEIESAGLAPQLVHAGRAKWMLGAMNKTDKLDAKGLNRLQRSGTLPTVWIPSAELRDARDLPRTRMMLARERTRLKNRIHATLDKYALSITEVSDTFGTQGRQLLAERLPQLPEQTRFATERLLEQLDRVIEQLGTFEERMKQVFEETEEINLLKSAPGIGSILAVVIATEIGDVRRFPRASSLASYAGTTPRVHSSGGKTKHGSARSDVNRYLKWAFKEAANVVCRNRGKPQWQKRHVSQLYNRIKRRRGHPQAIGAVARHLAEASYWMLTKREPYRDPGLSSREA